MRKLSTVLVTLALTGGAVMAQDAGKLVKSGSKSLSKYVSDPSMTGELDNAIKNAKQAIDVASDDTDAFNAQLLYGNAQAAKVNAKADQIVQKNAEYSAAALLNPNAPEPNFGSMEVDANSSGEAIKAYKTAFNKAPKSKYERQALEGIRKVATSLNAVSNAKLSSGQYDQAYEPMSQLMEIDEFLRSKDQEPIFTNEDDLNKQNYILAVVGSTTGRDKEAMDRFKKLYDAGYNESTVYSNYANVLMKSGKEQEALKVMEKGRELFPENSEILFAEINYYIRKEDYSTLETKLQEAIAKEPNNAGLYNALGNVYTSLSQDDAGLVVNPEYMEKSIGYYDKAIEIDPKNVDAIYSIGSMYYNQAAAKTNEMNQLGTSKADQKKYDELTKEIATLYEKALPYFVKAEKIDGNDRNTLIALKEIYARQNNYEKSKEYKDRLDAL